MYTQKKQVFYITFYDITKYKVKEIELKNTIKKYKYLIELSADAIIIRNLNGDIIYCNKSALNLFGYSLEEMKNLNMIDLVPRSVMKDIGFNMSIGDKPVERVTIKEKMEHIFMGRKQQN